MEFYFTEKPVADLFEDCEMVMALLEKWAPPDWFLDVNRNAYGEEAVEIAQGIPATVEYLSMHWDIRIAAPYANMLQNFVVPVVRRDGSEAVLKISADKRMILRQAATLCTRTVIT